MEMSIVHTFVNMQGKRSAAEQSEGRILCSPSRSMLRMSLRSWRVALFYRQRIGRRAYRARDRDRGGDEHEIVHLVAGAIVREILEGKELAHGHAHDRDSDPMPGLVDAGFGVVGPHLAAPGIAGKRRKLRARDPLQRLEGKARGVAAGISVPTARCEAALHLSGAHNNIVATLDRPSLHLRRLVQVRAGAAIAVIKRLLAESTRHIEQDATADHLVL